MKRNKLLVKHFSIFAFHKYEETSALLSYTLINLPLLRKSQNERHQSIFMDILKTKEFARNMYQIPSFLVALNQHRESFPRRLKEGKG